MTAQEYADGLRQIAQFYEEHPEVILPSDRITVYLWERKEFLAAAATLARAGGVEKSVDDRGGLSYFRVKRQFGAVTLELIIDRTNICKLVRPAEYECPDSIIAEALGLEEAKETRADA